MPKKVSYGIAPYRIKKRKMQVLLMRAPKSKEWGFVKGGMDLGETPKESAVREAHEEIGVTIPTEYLEQLIYTVNKKKNVGIFMVDDAKMCIKKKNLTLSKREVAECKWFTISNKMIKKINKNQQAIYKEILNQNIKRRFYFKERRCSITMV